MKIRINFTRDRVHLWDGETFNDHGRPVAACNPNIQLYPRDPARIPNLNVDAVSACMRCEKKKF